MWIVVDSIEHVAPDAQGRLLQESPGAGSGVEQRPAWRNFVRGLTAVEAADVSSLFSESEGSPVWRD